MNIVEKIRDTEKKLRSSTDPVRQLEHRTRLERLLGRMPVDQGELKRICEQRDSVGLDDMITRLENPEALKKEEPLPEFTQTELNDALRAFRHRLKYMRLDQESQISQREVTSGKRADIGAIQPPGPSEFNPKIWKVLVKKGMLVDEGKGFYREPYSKG